MYSAANKYLFNSACICKEFTQFFRPEREFRSFVHITKCLGINLPTCILGYVLKFHVGDEHHDHPHPTLYRTCLATRNISLTYWLNPDHFGNVIIKPAGHMDCVNSKEVESVGTLLTPVSRSWICFQDFTDGLLCFLSIFEEL